MSILLGMDTGIEKTIKTKLTRKKWLEFSLELLIKEGNTKLRIDNLVRCMGVTKGSFYWHFKNRDDFILSLVEHWIQISTLVVVEHMQQVPGDAKKRLFELLKFIVINDLTRYDVAIRAWALMEPQVAHIVRQADQRRLEFVRNLFAEMGFEGNELEMRARTLITFHAMENGLLIDNTKEDRFEMLRMRHAMFTHPLPDG